MKSFIYTKGNFIKHFLFKCPICMHSIQYKYPLIRIPTTLSVKGIRLSTVYNAIKNWRRRWDAYYSSINARNSADQYQNLPVGSTYPLLQTYQCTEVFFYPRVGWMPPLVGNKVFTESQQLQTYSSMKTSDLKKV